MRVNLGTIDVTDEERRAWNRAKGRKGGLATRAEIAAFAQTVVRAELSDAQAAIAGGAGVRGYEAAAAPTEPPEPPERPRRRDGPKCRHCNQPEGAACHQFGTVPGAHRFNAAPWGDQ